MEKWKEKPELVNCENTFVNNQHIKNIEYSDFLTYFYGNIEPRDYDNLLSSKLEIFKQAMKSIYERKFDKKENFKEYTLLDVCCKDGRFVEEAKTAELIKQGFNTEMTDAWVKYGKKKKRNIKLEDPMALSYEDNEFDIVYAYKLFGYVKDNKKVLQELVRVSKKYIIILSDEFKGHRNLKYATTDRVSFYGEWIDSIEDLRDMYVGKSPYNREDYLMLLVKGYGRREKNEKY